MPPPDVTAPDGPAAAALPVRPSAADAAAERVLDANLGALGTSQPRVAERMCRLDAPVTPVFGRDGSLTAFDEAGRWWSGCSLPLRAAREMLKSLDVRGPVACFLDPPHAGHLRVAMEMLRPWQAVIAVVPDERAVRVMLQCEDFSPEIAHGRLWFACGDAWAARLEALFDHQPGLSTPSQFIRLPSADPKQMEPLIAAAQNVFPRVLGRRAEEIRALRDAWRPGAEEAGRVCVVAPTRFELWDDAPFALYAALERTGAAAGLELLPVRSDEPTSASPLAVARAAASCAAIVTADSGRGEVPELLPLELPWVTWVTRPKVPPFQSSGPNDALLVADPAWREMALGAGWPAERVQVAGWPLIALEQGEETGPTFAALIADTLPLDPPERLGDFSSHLLLWNTLRAELTHDPFAAGFPDRLLDERMRHFGVSPDGLDRRLFAEALIAPAFAQGIARTLVAARVPLQLFGKGWTEIEEFRAHARGPVEDRTSLRRVVRSATALVHAWPSPHAHPLDACGRPVVRYRGGGAAALVAGVRAALGGIAHTATPARQLSAAELIGLINRVSGGRGGNG